MKRAETALGKLAVAYLVDLRWEVFQEVEGPGGGVADIVGTLGVLLCVVEVKASLTFEVIAQARRWLGFAHQSWIAVPAENRAASDGRHLAYSVCEGMGIGVLLVGDHRVEMKIPAALQRRARAGVLRDRLRPEHKTYSEAGTATGRRWTPFTETCRNVRDFLRERGGVAPLGEVVRGVKHHYRGGEAGARSALARWAELGKIESVALDRSTKPLALRLLDAKEAAT